VSEQEISRKGVNKIKNTKLKRIEAAVIFYSERACRQAGVEFFVNLVLLKPGFFIKRVYIKQKFIGRSPPVGGFAR